MGNRASLIGVVNDTSGKPITIALTRGRHVTMVGACAVLPLTRAGARQLIDLLREAVQALERKNDKQPVEYIM